MCIGVEGEACGEVTQHSADCFDVHAILERDGCKGVAQVVESDLWDTCPRFSILFTLSGEIGPPFGEGKMYWSFVLAFCVLRTSIACCEMVTAR